jgi:acetyl-CoA carboxylase carboxyltransferase component
MSADEQGGEGARDDLAELLRREALTRDDARADAVRQRHEAGGRTARENIDDLVDPGSFVEYGRFAIAAQRGRREIEELIERTPADGLVGGTARINGDLFGERSACAVLAYDYTVLAGTQGALGHRKKDRLFELIERMRLPSVLFAEGGGGRPGDTDYPVRITPLSPPSIRGPLRSGRASRGWFRASPWSRAAVLPATRCWPAARI